MTRYETETEAESYEAATLARIALDAAMEAVDHYQRRHGVCDAPFRVSLSVDNGNEADREVSAPDYPRIFATPDGIVGDDDGWIRHDGSDECPVHPMDVVELWQKPLGSTQHLANKPGNPASIYGWSPITHYRPLRDEDGVPYCSAEGLEGWAEYVATDRRGDVWQFKICPVSYDSTGGWSPGFLFTGEADMATIDHANTRDHWTQTLRRVYRREDA